MSAVPFVKGFKLDYVFNFAEESDIKLAAITFITTKVSTLEVTQKKGIGIVYCEKRCNMFAG